METAVRSQYHGMSNGLAHIKRRHPRVAVQGFVGDIADGNFVLGGIVEDVSSGGFKMSNLPGNFSASDHSYTTVVSGKGKHYRVIVIPCWTKKVKNSRFMEVGFKIMQASWEWSELIMNAALPAGSGDDIGFHA
jgi:hypothetical protein